MLPEDDVVRDGIYIKNGNYLKYYTFEGVKNLEFKEKIDLLNVIYANKLNTMIVIGNMLKLFNEYISLEDLSENGVNATEKIGLNTTVNDIEKNIYCFATGIGINKPIIGEGSGTFITSKVVVINCETSGVKIRYTTDGSDPTFNSSEYKSELTISESKTIKAKAFSNDGLIMSETAIAFYTKESFVTSGIFYAGKNYKGKLDIGSEDPVEMIDDDLVVTEPTARNFSCDGYFDFKGVYSRTGASKYVRVGITKVDTGESSFYYISGNFDRKIWLRYGAGTYRVKVYPITLEKEVTINEPYDGEIVSYSFDIAVFYKFEVTNTRDEDGRFLYPSDYIQSDESLIYETAKKQLEAAGVSNGTVKEKAKALHDYTVNHLEYDDSSTVLTKRKKQDAITCLNNGLAVCEGYTSLYNALLRSQGIQAKAILGNNKTHAWSNVLGEDENWYFVDTTWDECVYIINDGPSQPGVMYKYFWLPGNTGLNGDHSWNEDRDYRTVSKEKNIKREMIREGIEKE